MQEDVRRAAKSRLRRRCPALCKTDNQMLNWAIDPRCREGRLNRGNAGLTQEKVWSVKLNPEQLHKGQGSPASCDEGGGRDHRAEHHVAQPS